LVREILGSGAGRDLGTGVGGCEGEAGEFEGEFKFN